jgi:hypothetical protein
MSINDKSSIKSNELNLNLTKKTTTTIPNLLPDQINSSIVINLLNDESSSSSTLSNCSYTTSCSNSSINTSLKHYQKLHYNNSTSNTITVIRSQTKGGASQNENANNNSHNNTESSLRSFINGNDIVSNILKESVLDSDNMNLKTKKMIEESGNSNKRLKIDHENHKKQLTLDDSNVIIIDSDSDEDNTKEETRMDIDSQIIECNLKNNDQDDQEKHNDLFFDHELRNDLKISSQFKKCYVLVEKLDLERIKNKYGVRISVSDDSESSPKFVKNSPKATKKPNPIVNRKTSSKFHLFNDNSISPTKQASNNLRKFRSKSKTFPIEPVPSLSYNNNYFDLICNLDKITRVSNQISITSSIISPLNSNEKTTRSKSRANTFTNNSNFRSPNSSPLKSSPQLMFSPSSSLSMNTESGMMSSPAELLRKYNSSSVDYICEMDTLFKGSCVTVTQCLECETQRKSPESFYDRSIPIDLSINNGESASSPNLNNNNNSIKCEESLSVNWISKCLNNESYLNENSKYMCDICTTKQEAKIHTQYIHLPNILILHLLSYGLTER